MTHNRDQGFIRRQPLLVSRQMAYDLTHDDTFVITITGNGYRAMNIHSYGARPENSKRMSAFLRKSLQYLRLPASNITEISHTSPFGVADTTYQAAERISTRKQCPSCLPTATCSCSKFAGLQHTEQPDTPWHTQQTPIATPQQHHTLPTTTPAPAAPDSPPQTQTVKKKRTKHAKLPIYTRPQPHNKHTPRSTFPSATKDFTEPTQPIRSLKDELEEYTATYIGSRSNLRGFNDSWLDALMNSNQTENNLKKMA